MSTRRDREDHALLIGWRNGSARAGHALHLAHGDALARFFATKVSAPTRVAELVQRTLLRAQRTAPPLGLGVRAVLFAHARAELRRHAERVLAGVRRRGERPDLEGVDDLTAADLDPGRTLSTRLVDQVLRGLLLDDQILLELIYWEGLALPELAAIFAVPQGALVVRLRRARARFAAGFDDLTRAAGPRRRLPGEHTTLPDLR